MGDSSPNNKHSVPIGVWNFEEWVEQVGIWYGRLSDDDRNKTLDHLISVSSASQLYHLSRKLDLLVKRDFLRSLPTELAFHIVSYFDSKTLLTCCRVSKQWNRVINSCADVWKRACCSIGVTITKDDKNGRYYKDLYLTVSERLKGMKDGSAFESLTLQGHSDRIMAIFYKDGKLATGSDDRTVRLWDCKSGVCTSVIQTHTVADLKFDDKHLVTGSFDSTAACWDIITGEQLRTYQGHVAAVFTIDFNVELDILVSGSADNLVKLWTFSTGELLRTFARFTDWVTKVMIVQNLHCANPESSYYVISASSSDGPTVSLSTVDSDHESQGGLSWRFRHYVPHFQIRDDTLYFPTVTSKGAILKLEKLDANMDVSKTSYSKFWDNSDVHVVFGIGAKYFAFVSGETPMLRVMETPVLGSQDNSQEVVNTAVIASKALPNVRLSKRGSTFTLGDTDWLDGLSDVNHRGVVFAASQQDNSVYILKWKKIRKRRSHREARDSRERP